MQTELKKNWIEALRSGEFKQVKNTLTNGEAYCCLGVLCKIGGASKLGEIYNEDEGRFNQLDCFELNKTIAIVDLPEEYLKEFGLTDNQQSTLIIMNDTDNKTFSEIADYIEVMI